MSYNFMTHKINGIAQAQSRMAVRYGTFRIYMQRTLE